MEKIIKLSESQLTKITQLKNVQNELEMQLSLVLQRQQDIIDIIAEYEGIQNIERVDFISGNLIFKIKD